MEAQVEQAQKDLDFNTVNFQRQEQLIANNFTPRATFDAARNTLQNSQQKLASLKAQLAGIAANLNGNPDAPIEDHPNTRMPSPHAMRPRVNSRTPWFAPPSPAS